MVRICTSTYPEDANTKYDAYFSLFPYELSDFQKYAIEAVVEGHHTLICVPTGSGKTLPAIFTILHMHSIGKKVIYTGPIKSLLNQKYYDFTTNYPHIQFGLMTGDIKLNPDADVILMTAEILANALFHGNGTGTANANTASTTSTTTKQLQFNIDIDTELGAVVMDEVHYINDEGRGAVWEKTILMLPHHVQMVMLSATLDNPHQFAQWIESTRGDPSLKSVYLSYNSIRHVPLTHYAFVACPESSIKLIKDKTTQTEMKQNTGKLILLQNETGAYSLDGYKKVRSALELIEERGIHVRRKFILNNLCEYMRVNELLPAICFVFSRKNVEACAGEITANLLEDDSKIPYTMAYECEQIIRAKLSNWREYADLQEYKKMVALLEKGIGIHHSGMIPILREIVEIMITRGNVKLLFATESFAIGLDCPIRTAIFTSVMKYDGNIFRELYAHEYNQAGGRAGRRGRDKVGYVIHCYLNGLSALPPSANYQKILCGKPQTLVSKYEINYSTILDLMKKGQQCDFHLFSEKSMMRGQLMGQISSVNIELDNVRALIAQKEKSVQYLRTPVEVCRRFILLEKQVKTLVNKKKKEAEKEMAGIKDQWKTLSADMKLVGELDEFLVSAKSLADQKEYLEVYVKTRSLNICHILHKMQFIVCCDEVDSTTGEQSQKFALTPKGRLASHISEIHPLVLSSMIITGKLDKLNVVELIGLLSCFTDVKIEENMRKPYINTKNVDVKTAVEIMLEYYEKYRTVEYDVLATYLTHPDEIMWDIIDPIMYWAEWCNDEYACKLFMAKYTSQAGSSNVFAVQKGMDEDLGDLGDLGENGMAENVPLFSVGDFTKACLKISAISKEISAVCEEMGMVELAHKLVQIDTHLLKYIATTQSLYV